METTFGTITRSFGVRARDRRAGSVHRDRRFVLETLDEIGRRAGVGPVVERRATLRWARACPDLRLSVGFATAGPPSPREIATVLAAFLDHPRLQVIDLERPAGSAVIRCAYGGGAGRWIIDIGVRIA